MHAIKKIIATGFLALPTTVTASDVVTISPGSSTIIQPSDQITTVICSGATEILDEFCTCVDPGSSYMKNLNKIYVFSNGTTKELSFGRYRTVNDCSQAMAANPACNK